MPTAPCHPAAPGLPTRRQALAGAAALAMLPCGTHAAAAGEGDWIEDSRVTPAFAARFPAAARIDAAGRGRRLADRAISPEAFGARGDGVANDQPAIQQAVEFAQAVCAREVRFRARRYALWTPRRVSDPEVNDRHDGHALVIAGRLTLRGAPGGTSLLYRSLSGRGLDRDWQIVAGKVWRGAGIFLRGLEAVPADARARPGVTLIGMTLDGGCPQGRVFAFPARLGDGDGWDLTHKGLWSQNDRVTGDWMLIDSTVRRFRGELFYQGGRDHGAFTGRNIRMGETNADILNPGGTNLDIEDGVFHDGFQGWEGWGGRAGRLIRCRFERCRQMGGIQGGRVNFEPNGNWEAPRRFESGVVPWLTLDVVAADCGAVAVGNWVRGRITLIDSVLYLSQTIYPELHDVDLDVVALADSKAQLESAVSIHAARRPGARALSRIHLRLTVGATAAARAAGRRYGQPVEWGGSLGEDIVVRLGRCLTRRDSHPSYPATDVPPRIVAQKVATRAQAAAAGRASRSASRPAMRSR